MLAAKRSERTWPSPGSDPVPIISFDSGTEIRFEFSATLIVRTFVRDFSPSCGQPGVRLLLIRLCIFSHFFSFFFPSLVSFNAKSNPSTVRKIGRSFFFKIRIETDDRVGRTRIYSISNHGGNKSLLSFSTRTVSRTFHAILLILLLNNTPRLKYILSNIFKRKFYFTFLCRSTRWTKRTMKNSDVSEMLDRTIRSATIRLDA